MPNLHEGQAAVHLHPLISEEVAEVDKEVSLSEDGKQNPYRIHGTMVHVAEVRLGDSDAIIGIGGFPDWLKYALGVCFRTDNEPFKRAIEGFCCVGSLTSLQLDQKKRVLVG